MHHLMIIIYLLFIFIVLSSSVFDAQNRQRNIQINTLRVRVYVCLDYSEGGVVVVSVCGGKIKKRKKRKEEVEERHKQLSI